MKPRDADTRKNPRARINALLARARTGRPIGLLGGSFNPAHDGHLHITHVALKRFRLAEVWWMVSPQNPLKSTTDMAPLAERMASARALARDRRIVVTDIETDLESVFTADTLAKLRRRAPGANFIWLMGADNLAQISRWQRWTDIFRLMPVAIFDRPGHAFPALAAKAAKRFSKAQLSSRRARRLTRRKPPAWVFMHIRTHPASATEIRRQRRILGQGRRNTAAGDKDC